MRKISPGLRKANKRASDKKYVEKNREKLKKRATERARIKNNATPRVFWPKDPELYKECLRKHKRKCYLARRDKHLLSSKEQHIKYRKRVYGITAEQYDAKVIEQNGLCAICNLPDKRGKDLSVDHCHTTKYIRGLLCGNCNLGLGNFYDDPAKLLAAAQYIQKALDVQSSNCVATFK